MFASPGLNLLVSLADIPHHPQKDFCHVGLFFAFPSRLYSFCFLRFFSVFYLSSLLTLLELSLLHNCQMKRLLFPYSLLFNALERYCLSTHTTPSQCRMPPSTLSSYSLKLLCTTSYAERILLPADRPRHNGLAGAFRRVTSLPPCRLYRSVVEEIFNGQPPCSPPFPYYVCRTPFPWSSLSVFPFSHNLSLLDVIEII